MNHCYLLCPADPSVPGSENTGEKKYEDLRTYEENHWVFFTKTREKNHHSHLCSRSSLFFVRLYRQRELSFKSPQMVVNFLRMHAKCVASKMSEICSILCLAPAAPVSAPMTKSLVELCTKPC